jgi:dipeptidyl aminopeptidase/acylaminoacyl peptidase
VEVQRLKLCKLPLVLVLALFPAAYVCAQPPTHPLTIDDLWKVQRLGKPAMAPDGKWVAVELTSYSMESNDSTSAIWLLSTDGKTQRQLTTFKGKNSGPVWSPDSKTIAFVSKRTGNVAQIYLIAADGGEARQLSHLPMNPTGLKWGPDGKTMFAIVHTWPDTPDDASYRKRENDRKADKVQAMIIDDAMYRYWDSWLADGKRPVVFAIDAASGQHKNLFAGLKLSLPATTASAESYDISPDGHELCFTADSVKEIGTDSNLDLYIMRLDQPSEPKNITTDNPVSDYNPVYSPDGKRIAYLRQTIKYFYADRARVMIWSQDTGKNEEVTGNLDRSCGVQHWQGKENRILFEAEDKGFHRLYSLDLANMGSTCLTKNFSDSDTAPSSDAAGKWLAFLKSTFDYPAQVWVREQKAKGAAFRRLESFNDALRKQWELGSLKEVYYKGADNEDVQLWIVYPPRFDATKKWPLLMVVHGGPHNAIPSDFHFRWNLQLLAAGGYVVACPNFHGSSGFGQKFTDSITGDMATKPFLDVMKATDYMERLSYIDKDRMAAAGASYGGYMMSWLNGHTDRFKALVCHAGVYNWHSMMASDVVRGRQRPLGAPPWGDLTRIDKQSPQRFAANFKTPTLVMHGEKDFRVPVTQGFEYYNTLRMKGVPTRLVYFPDENHWVLKPQNARLWTHELFAWLDKYVGHGPNTK